MPFRISSHRLARVFGVLRGTMLIIISIVLLVASDKVVAGSSAGAAHALALMLGSRTFVVGAALAILAIRGTPVGLGWVLLADCAFQLFDTAMALTSAKGAVAAVPAVIAAIDAWAGITLFRSTAVHRRSAH